MELFRVSLPTFGDHSLLKDPQSSRALLDILVMMRDSGQMQFAGFVILPNALELICVPGGAHSIDTVLVTLKEDANHRLKRFHAREDFVHLPNALKEALKVNPNWTIFSDAYDVREISEEMLRVEVDRLHQLPVLSGLCMNIYHFEFSSAYHPELVTV